MADGPSWRAVASERSEQKPPGGTPVAHWYLGVPCELTEVRNCGRCSPDVLSTVGMESFLEEKSFLAPSSLLHGAVCSPDQKLSQLI